MKSRSAKTSSGSQEITRSSRRKDGRLYANSPVGTPQPCACGCGGTPKWNPRFKKWGKYIFGHTHRAEESRYAKRMYRMRRLEDHLDPPPCRCGCGKPVKVHRHGAANFWADYLFGHQNVGKSDIMSAEGKQRNSDRMKRDNPMRRPGVAARARRSKCLATSPSKQELRFAAFAISHNLPLRFVGDGNYWVRQKNPDFKVRGQLKIIEITTIGIFNGWWIEPRTRQNYAEPMIEYYQSGKHRCLVVFCHQDNRRRLPSGLAGVVRDFSSKESDWSGIWDSGVLTRFDTSQGVSRSTTSPVRPSQRSLPMG